MVQDHGDDRNESMTYASETSDARRFGRRAKRPDVRPSSVQENGRSSRVATSGPPECGPFKFAGDGRVHDPYLRTRRLPRPLPCLRGRAPWVKLHGERSRRAAGGVGLPVQQGSYLNLPHGNGWRLRT